MPNSLNPLRAAFLALARMAAVANLANLDADPLRAVAARFVAEMQSKQALTDKLTHEMTVLKRIKCAATSDVYTCEHQRQIG